MMTEHWTLSQCLDRHKKLHGKFWKSKADKREIEVLEQAIEHLLSKSVAELRERDD